MGNVSVVTGGAGFVGRHLIRRLLERGDEVHAIDPLAPLTGAIDPAAGWPLFEPRDFRSFHFHNLDCRQWFDENRAFPCDCAFHLAAMVGGRLMIEYNPLAVADDLSIDAAYWQWARRTTPGKTICFSSSAAYPIALQTQHRYTLLKEDVISFSDNIGMPDMSYGWAKLTCEYLAQLAYERHGLKSVIFRPFSGYGEDQDVAYPFPSICKRILEHKGASEIKVWGSGQQMRDFIYIDDCVNGILGMMNHIDDAGAVNLSTGILTSFATFAAIAADLSGYNPKVIGTSDKPEGVFARGGDTAKQKSLGFCPTIDFRSGIERALNYFSV